MLEEEEPLPLTSGAAAIVVLSIEEPVVGGKLLLDEKFTVG